METAEKLDKKDVAKKLYVRGSSPKAISETLGVALQTVYSWRKQDSGDSVCDWDASRRRYNLSPAELGNIFIESVKDMILEVSADPLKLADVRYADAITKSLTAAKKINPYYNYLGAILDLIEKTDLYLKREDPPLAKKMREHWPRIKEELEQFAAQDGLFR